MLPEGNAVRPRLHIYAKIWKVGIGDALILPYRTLGKIGNATFDIGFTVLRHTTTGLACATSKGAEVELLTGDKLPAKLNGKYALTLRHVVGILDMGPVDDLLPAFSVAVAPDMHVGVCRFVDVLVAGG